MSGDRAEAEPCRVGRMSWLRGDGRRTADGPGDEQEGAGSTV